MSETEAILHGMSVIVSTLLVLVGGLWTPRASSVAGPVCLAVGATVALARIESMHGQSRVSLAYACLVGAATTLAVIRYRTRTEETP